MAGEPPRPLYFVFSCYDYKHIIAKLSQRAHMLKLKKLTELEGLQVFLTAVVRERAGYEREAIELIHQRVGPHLGNMLNLLQQIFNTYKYVSLINASKETAPEIITAWKESNMKFFEFKLLGDAKAFTSPWSGQVPRVRLLTLEGAVTQASYLIFFNKSGHDLDLAEDQYREREGRVRARFQAQQAAEEAAEGGAGGSPTHQATLARQATVQQAALSPSHQNTLARQQTTSPKKLQSALNRTGSTTIDRQNAYTQASTPKRQGSTLGARQESSVSTVSKQRSSMMGGAGFNKQSSSAQLDSLSRTRTGLEDPAESAKPTLHDALAKLRREVEMVDDPWLSVRHISGHGTRRIDFAIKRKRANEWVFVEFLALDSLLYDPDARQSALAKVMAERPVIHLEQLMQRTEGKIKKFPSDARQRDPKHNGKFFQAQRLETLDLSTPKENFQIEGYSRSGIPKDPKNPHTSFDGSRTRWCKLKLHEFFDGRQVWRIQVKGKATWGGLGNASREGFN